MERRGIRLVGLLAAAGLIVGSSVGSAGIHAGSSLPTPDAAERIATSPPLVAVLPGRPEPVGERLAQRRGDPPPPSNRPWALGTGSAPVAGLFVLARLRAARARVSRPAAAGRVTCQRAPPFASPA